MTDIIKDAQRLLDGATPGPWELINGEIHQIQHTPEQCTSFRCDHRWPVLSENWGENPGVAAADEDLTLMAAAPELAQALAEETYEYTQEIYFNGKWQPIYEDLWYDNPEECESLFLDIEPWKWNNEPVRIVRRRVSPVEVISD